MHITWGESDDVDSDWKAASELAARRMRAAGVAPIDVVIVSGLCFTFDLRKLVEDPPSIPQGVHKLVFTTHYYRFSLWWKKFEAQVLQEMFDIGFPEMELKMKTWFQWSLLTLLGPMLVVATGWGCRCCAWQARLCGRARSPAERGRPTPVPMAGTATRRNREIGAKSGEMGNWTPNSKWAKTRRGRALEFHWGATLGGPGRARATVRTAPRCGRLRRFGGVEFWLTVMLWTLALLPVMHIVRYFSLERVPRGRLRHDGRGGAGRRLSHPDPLGRRGGEPRDGRLPL